MLCEGPRFNSKYHQVKKRLPRTLSLVSCSWQTPCTSQFLAVPASWAQLGSRGSHYSEYICSSLKLSIHSAFQPTPQSLRSFQIFRGSRKLEENLSWTKGETHPRFKNALSSIPYPPTNKLLHHGQATLLHPSTPTLHSRYQSSRPSQSWPTCPCLSHGLVSTSKSSSLGTSKNLFVWQKLLDLTK